MLLPMAQRVLKKVEAVIDEVLQELDCHKLEMPVMMPASLWKKTGRWVRLPQTALVQLPAFFCVRAYVCVNQYSSATACPCFPCVLPFFGDGLGHVWVGDGAHQGPARERQLPGPHARRGLHAPLRLGAAVGPRAAPPAQALPNRTQVQVRAVRPIGCFVALAGCRSGPSVATGKLFQGLLVCLPACLTCVQPQPAHSGLCVYSTFLTPSLVRVSFFFFFSPSRDEIRPRSGLLRAREFVMKDLYTFDESKERAEATYEVGTHACTRACIRMHACRHSGMHT